MREQINRLAAQADWVLPGLDEGRLLTGADTPEAVARHYRQQGAKLVVIKLGPDGAYFDGESGSGHVSGFPVARAPMCWSRSSAPASDTRCASRAKRCAASSLGGPKTGS